MKDYKEYVDMFVKGAKELAETVSDKTRQTASSVRVELDIKKAEQELDKTYRALGRIMYQIECGTLKRDEQIVKAACQQVRQQEELIARLQREKEDIKNRSSASEDGKEAEKPEEAPQNQPKPEKNKDGYFVLKFCPYCKVGNHPDATRCVSCGKEI